MAKGSTIRKNKYNKRVYEQIPLRVKKGEKEGISQCAQRYGMSTNAFILNAIDAYRISLHRDMIANLKEMIRPIAKKYGVESVYLFGSRARGDYRADSDFDFYIKKGRIRGYFALGGFFEELKEAVQAEIDLVSQDEEELDAYLREAIRKDGILLYEAA
jgi:predicted nucleotidyltransferase